MAFLVKYWKKYRRQFFICVVFLSMEAAADLLQPTIVSRIIDSGVKAGALDYVIRNSLLMLLITCMGAVGAVMRNQISSRVSQRFGAELRSDMFRKINMLSFAELGKYDAATFITRLTNDATQLQNFTNGLMRVFVKAPILCVGSFIMVILLNPRLALILAVTVPVVVGLIAASLRIGYPYFYRMQNALDRTNSVSREYLSGVRVVKAFNTFDGEVARYGAANYELTDISITAHRIMSVFSPIITFCVNMSVVALLWFAPGMIASSTLHVGEVVAFVNYMAQILTSLTTIFNVYQQFIRAKASGERVSEVLNKDEAETGGEAVMSGELRGGVEFSNVFFSYPNTQAEPVLDDISFNLKPRGTLGIIGSTGAGKTSLVNLIPGFYKPDSGTVYIDGADVGDYAFDELRRRISVVTQKVQLFTGTIADNIRWGDMDATDAQVEEAARAAQAHDFIMSLPNGYATVLGQNGVNLSGGQKQRVSIARALIRRPDILILDDCVSAVDVATEAAIMKAIGELMGSVTCIMITQRISSVINLPHIIVMDEGRVVGSGNHERLMAECEVYREISRSQLGRGASA